MDLTQIILVGLILTTGIAFQGAVGFGTGLFAIPLMVLIGVDLPSAVCALAATVTVQTAAGCWRYQKDIPWRETAAMTSWRYVGVPLGIFVLTLMAAGDRDRIKQVIGVVLFVVLAIQFFAKIKPRDRIRCHWTAIAGTTSGIMAGAFGIGGAPVVLWLMAHDWPARKTRALLWSTFLLIMPLQIGLLIYAFGWQAMYAMGIGLAYSPLTVVAALGGAALGDRLNRHRLRAIASVFLVLVALTAILGPYVY